MLLSSYMTTEGMTPEALALKMKGKASVSGIIKWMRQERTPRPDQQRLIFEITAGAVTPNDFVLSERKAKRANASAEQAA